MKMSHAPDHLPYPYTPTPDGYLITDEDLLDDIANGELPVSPRHPAPQAGIAAP